MTKILSIGKAPDFFFKFHLKRSVVGSVKECWLPLKGRPEAGVGTPYHLYILENVLPVGLKSYL